MGTCVAMVTVDGTDFCIQEPTSFAPGWYFHKLIGPGLCYEIAVSTNGGDIIYINRPFQCGSNSDITISRGEVINKLRAGKMVEADRGYKGEPTKIRIPVDYKDHQQKKQRTLLGPCMRLLIGNSNTW